MHFRRISTVSSPESFRWTTTRILTCGSLALIAPRAKGRRVCRPRLLEVESSDTFVSHRDKIVSCFVQCSCSSHRLASSKRMTIFPAVLGLHPHQVPLSAITTSLRSLLGCKVVLTPFPRARFALQSQSCSQPASSLSPPLRWYGPAPQPQPMAVAAPNAPPNRPLQRCARSRLVRLC